VLILDLGENPKHDRDLVWRAIDERKIIPMDPEEALDKEYDICITGSALKHFVNRPSWNDLVQNTWVYTRVSPSQKEYILTPLKSLGYVTSYGWRRDERRRCSQAGSCRRSFVGWNARGSGKDSRTSKMERIKVYESQLSISSRFNQPPPPIPPTIARLMPQAVEAQKKAAENQANARKTNPMEKVLNPLQCS
jgi:cation-transporting ATPase 13A1